MTVLLLYYVQQYATCCDLFIGHHQACSIKAPTKFLELGCPNMHQYYAVGSSYYLANTSKQICTQNLYVTGLLLMVKTYYIMD
jgi:hypothetical protein